MLPKGSVYKVHPILIFLVFAFLVLVSPVGATITNPADAQAYVSGTNYATVSVVPPSQFYFYQGTSMPADYFTLSSSTFYTIYSASGDTWTAGGSNSRMWFPAGGIGSSGKYKYVLQGTGYFYLYINTVNDLVAPVPDFSYDPPSPYVLETITFTDTTSGTFSSGYWDFGDNSTPVSGVNVTTHAYSSSGNFTVKHSVTYSEGVAWHNETLTVYSYQVPVAAFSCNPTNTTSPSLVVCTDSSTNDPTEWLWQLTSSGVSISPGGSYGEGVFTAVNLTQNPTFYMDGSGVVDVRLIAENMAGSDEEYKENYITISGIAPTPTPTPAIPWPNQTGICWRSGITLGSGEIRDFIVHYQLTNPQGDTYSGQYQDGVQNYIMNQPFFTALEGQYVYQELRLNNSELLWRQSYIVEDCTTPIPTQTTITGVPTPSVTYTIPATYPTLTYPTTRYTAPVTPVPYDTATPPPTIAVYPTIEFGAGSQDLYNYTLTVSPISKPIIDYLKNWLDGNIKTTIGSFLAIIISPFSFILGSIPQAITSFMSGMITFAVFPFLFMYAIGTFVKNMPEKVLVVFSILLWWNIIRYLWYFVRRRGY